MAIDWSLITSARPVNLTGHEMLMSALARATEEQRRRDEFNRELAAKHAEAAAQRELMSSHYKAEEAKWTHDQAEAEAKRKLEEADKQSLIEHRKSLIANARAGLQQEALKGVDLSSADPNALAGHEAMLRSAGLNVRRGVDALAPEEVKGRFEQQMGDLERPEAQAIQEQGKFADAAAANPDAAKALSFIKGLPGMGAVVPSVPDAPDPEKKRWADSLMGSFQGATYTTPIDQSKAIIADETGKPMATFDPARNALAKAATAQRLNDTLKGLPGVGGRAGSTAAALAQLGADPIKAATAGIEAGHQREALDTSEKNAAQMAAQRAVTTAGEGEARASNGINQFVTQYKTLYKLPEAQKLADEAAASLNALQSNTGIGDTVTLAKLGRSLYGAAQSNQEGGRLFNAGGLMERIANGLQRMENGQMSPGFREDIAELARRQMAFANQRKMSAARQAYHTAQKSKFNFIRDNADQIQSMISGVDLMPDEPAAPSAPSPKRTTTTTSVKLKGAAAAPSTKDPLDDVLEGSGH